MKLSNHDTRQLMFRLEGAKVAVLGYGGEGRAQARALRTAGNSIGVALPAGHASERVLADGFAVEPIDVAIGGASAIVVAMRHDAAPATFWYDCVTHVAPAALVVYRSALGLETGLFEPPGTDLVVLSGDGPTYRIAVHRDGTGRALVRGIAYARAAFGDAIAIEGSTVAAELDLELAAHGERCSGVFALLGAAERRREPEPSTDDRPFVVQLRSFR